MTNRDLDGAGSKGGQRIAAVLGAVMLAGVMLALISARLVPLALFGLLLAVVFGFVAAGRARDLTPPLGAVAAAFAAFLLFCFASTLWAEAGGKAVGKLLLMALTVSTALVLAHTLLSAEASAAARTARGLWIGFAIGLAFVLIEVLSGQSIQIFVYNLLQLPPEMLQPLRHFTWVDGRVATIEPAHINRNLAVVALLAFPASLAARTALARPWKVIIPAALVLLAGIAAGMSRHESSVVALAAGAAVFALAWMSSKWASRLMGAGWALACIAVLPLALAAGNGGLDKVPGLHHSLKHRFVIWNYTAEETLKSPVVGIGAYMTYVLGPERNKAAERAPALEGSEYKKTLSRHAHNVYLQTWYELGGIGAALLLAAGLAVLMAIRRLADAAQPWALATFAVAATMMSASYGMWQTWYVALFALAAVTLTVGVRAVGRAGHSIDDMD